MIQRYKHSATTQDKIINIADCVLLSFSSFLILLYNFDISLSSTIKAPLINYRTSNTPLNDSYQQPSKDQSRAIASQSI